MGDEKIYRLIDLVKQLDRDKSTLIRWEAEGKIPKAKRDIRGWRYYTPEDFASVVRFVETEINVPSAAKSSKSPEAPARARSGIRDDAAGSRDQFGELDAARRITGIASQESAAPSAIPGERDFPKSELEATEIPAAGWREVLAASVASFGITFAITTAVLGYSTIPGERVGWFLGSEPIGAAMVREEISTGGVSVAQQFGAVAHSAVALLGQGILIAVGEATDGTYAVIERTMRSMTRMGSGIIRFADSGAMPWEFAHRWRVVREWFDGAARLGGTLARMAAADLFGIYRGATDEVRELAAVFRWRIAEAQHFTGERGNAITAAIEDSLGSWNRRIADVALDVTDYAAQFEAVREEGGERPFPPMPGAQSGVPTGEPAEEARADVSVLFGTGILPESAVSGFVADGRIAAASKVFLAVHAVHTESLRVVRVEPASGFWVAADAARALPIGFDYVMFTPRPD